jgi:bifunctional non-homologous end joining protein LigD
MAKVTKGRAPAAGAIRGPVPEIQKPQLCSLVPKAPEGEGWISEVKFDGYRLIGAVENGKVRLLTRNGLDWAARMPSVARAIGELPVRSVMIDGELIRMRDDGLSSFPGLQAALKAGRDDRLLFYVFDLLHLDGWDLRPCSLLKRKQVMEGLTEWTAMLRYSDHQVGQAPAMWHSACQMQLEGIVCKQADAPYHSGRGGGWVKVKCTGREELIVLGWTPPAGSRVGIGAVHVGYYDRSGQLYYAGGVGSGFDDKELQAFRGRLDGMQTATPPPSMLVSGDPIDTSITWVRPEIVIEVQYTAWSGAGRVRHPVYLGTREDKAARDVVREVADPDAERVPFTPRTGRAGVKQRKGWHGAVPPLPRI